jgi:hypothetical protein
MMRYLKKTGQLNNENFELPPIKTKVTTLQREALEAAWDPTNPWNREKMLELEKQTGLNYFTISSYAYRKNGLKPLGKVIKIEPKHEMKVDEVHLEPVQGVSK